MFVPIALNIHLTFSCICKLENIKWARQYLPLLQLNWLHRMSCPHRPPAGGPGQFLLCSVDIGRAGVMYTDFIYSERLNIMRFNDTDSFKHLVWGSID